MTNLEGRVILRRRRPRPARRRADRPRDSRRARRGAGPARLVSRDGGGGGVRRAAARLRRRRRRLLRHHLRASRHAGRRVLALSRSHDHPGTPRLFAGALPDRVGRARFHPTPHAEIADERTAEFPLFLTTGRILGHYQSGTQTRRSPELAALAPEPIAELHPATARTRRRRRRRDGRPDHAARQRDLQGPADPIDSRGHDLRAFPLERERRRQSPDHRRARSDQPACPNSRCAPFARSPPTARARHDRTTSIWSSSATAWPAPASSKISSPATAAASSTVTVFGDEPHGNYNRILLSGVLAGTHKPDDILINPLAWYTANGVTLHAGTRVERIDLDDAHGDRRGRDHVNRTTRWSSRPAAVPFMPADRRPA